MVRTICDETALFSMYTFERSAFGLLARQFFQVHHEMSVPISLPVSTRHEPLSRSANCWQYVLNHLLFLLLSHLKAIRVWVVSEDDSGSVLIGGFYRQRKHLQSLFGIRERNGGECGVGLILLLNTSLIPRVGCAKHLDDDDVLVRNTELIEHPTREGGANAMKRRVGELQRRLLIQFS